MDIDTIMAKLLSVLQNSGNMMSEGLTGHHSPFQCLEVGDSLPSSDPDMCSFYPEPMPSKSVGFCSPLDHKSFTVDGGKVYANLEQSQVLPNIRAFSKVIISSPPHCDTSLCSQYDVNLSSPPATSPPSTQTGATPIVVQRTWQSKHPGNWTSEDVLDWVFFVAGCYNIDQHVEGEAFRDVTGQDLLAMDSSGFKPLTAEHHNKFFDFFTQLKNRSNFKAPQDQDSPLLSSTSEHLQGTSGNSLSQHCIDYNMGDPSSSGSLPDSAVIHIDRFDYSVDLTDNFPEVIAHRTHQETAACSDDGYSSGGSDNRNNVIAHTNDFQHHQHQQQQHHHHQQQQQQQQQPHQQLGSHYVPPVLSTIPSFVADTTEHQMDDEDEDEDFGDLNATNNNHNNISKGPKLAKPEGQVVRTRGRKPGQTTRGNHLWEFVRDLLKDERYTPTLIKWENREKGVFRFVQSAQVAKMWGRRKNNQTMNYEKLSRAMRFCRGKDYFADLPKSEKYPKKLCFRFGTRAHGWQTDN